MNKNKDPYPITDIYFLEMNAVDAATVTVGDLCERLTNDFQTGLDGLTVDEINDEFSTTDASKKNSISFGNGADGGYSVWVGVNSSNKVRKIIASANSADYMEHPDSKKNYISFEQDKNDINDQFFSKSGSKKSRIKLFDLNTQSGLIAVGDHAGPLRELLGINDDLMDYNQDGSLKDLIDTKYFCKKGIFQNNVPIFIVKFVYGLTTKTQSTSFTSSSIHKIKNEPYQKTINYSYTELFSNLLNESCYPTKYIFEQYLVEKEEFDYDSLDTDFNLRIKKDAKISGVYLSDRLPKALEILRKQSKILFKDNFKEIFEIRKTQFEDFIHGIIKDIEPQELTLPTFGKKKIKNKFSNKVLEIKSTDGIAHLFDGYKFKDDVAFDSSNIIFPLKKGLYPTYLHIYDEDTEDIYNEDTEDTEVIKYAQIKIVVEGIEGCYLNKDKNCKLIVNNKPQESKNITNVINNKIKSITIDKIDLRNSRSLKELEKLTHIEQLTLSNIKNIKDWSSLTKLKNLKNLKLESCVIAQDTSVSFFKNLYALPKLEKLTLFYDCYLQAPIKKDKFSSKLYPKKLKDFEIIFDDQLKSGKPSDERYKDFKGYASSDVFQHNYNNQIIYINEFPNFEKFKAMEKLRFYNLFDADEEEGLLFSFYETDFEDDLKMINDLCKVSKIKDIWIYGYNFKKVEELANTKFLKFALEILSKTKIKLNGVTEKTFKKLIKKNKITK